MWNTVKVAPYKINFEIVKINSVDDYIWISCDTSVCILWNLNNSFFFVNHYNHVLLSLRYYLSF